MTAGGLKLLSTTNRQRGKMSREINFHTEDLSFQLDQKTSIVEWIQSSVASETKDYSALNFIFCSDNYLHKINLEYLSHDTFTDIITFDYTENNQLSGDIFISVDRVKENSAKLKTDFQEELARVIIHGVLHLCGYKDKKPEEQAIMRQKEDYYLNLRPSN